jgi:benzoate/toluate 1,2-dioxygenase alpha subunit
LSAAGPDWIVLSRGLGQEQQTESGERIGAFSDEVPQRAFWRRWREMMSSEARMEVAAE